MEFDKDGFMIYDESSMIEYKRSEIKLSDDLFESYSAFANTNGGRIFLGIGEENIDGAKRTYPILGLKNAHRQEEQINTSFADKNIVSYNAKTDVIIRTTMDGLKYIEIVVAEAPNSEKPVEVHRKGEWRAFLREGSSDRKMTRAEYQTFIRNQSENLDGEVLVDYFLNDLDLKSVRDYRRLVEAVPKFEHFKDYTEEDFLRNISVLVKDREKDKEGITIGGLLFFGKPQEIIHRFPYFQMDLFDRRGKVENERWQHRISTVSDNLNIYQFFIRSYEYLQNVPLSPFKLDENLARIEVGDLMKTALREALINIVMHSDYFSEEHEVINIYWDYIDFENGGSMKISPKDFFTTTASKTRNPIISKLLIFMNFGERAGTGGEQIASSVRKSQFRFPELESDFEKTKLRIWMVDFADSIEGLSENEAIILKLLTKLVSPISSKEIREKTGLSFYYAREALNELLEKEYIEVQGNKRSTVYQVKQNLEQQIVRIKQIASDLKLPSYY